MVMYGDSLTDGWTWSTRGQAAFQKYFGLYRVLNAGITGTPRLCSALRAPRETACILAQCSLCRPSDTCNRHTRLRKLKDPLLAAAGEQTGPLLWRIRDGGEMARVNRPRVVYLMIGTNDFRANPCHGNPLALLLRVQAVFNRYVPPSRRNSCDHQ